MRGSSVASEAAPGLPPPPTTEHLTARQDSTEGADLDGAAASHLLHLRSAGMIALATPALPPIVAGMAWYLRPVADRPALLGWVGVHLLLATLLTIAGAVSWRSRRALRPSAVEPAIVWLIGLLGVTVGMSSLVLTLPEGTAQQAMVIQLYVAGVSSSAIMTFGPLARNFMAFAVPANGLNAVGIVAGVNEVPVFLAAVALAYLVVLVGCHHVLASATREAIVGQVRAERLLAHLRIERDRVASANEALRHQAATDPLTGVANRRQFFELLGGALARSRRSGELVAVLFIDLDQFKSLNDTRGHATGDAVLTEAARRMADAVRAGDVVARRGGDEFTVLLASPASTVDALAVADRIRARLSEPVPTPSGDVQLTASIGLACNDDLGTDAEALMHEADIALYRAKAEGRNRVVALDTEIRRQAAARRAEEEDLRRGLAVGEVVAWFQPVVHLGRGTVTGAETLARWQHPTRGLVLPGSFLPLVREHALDEQLQRRMVDDALAALATLRAAGRIGPSFRISVNVDGGRVDLVALADALSVAGREGFPWHSW